MKLDLYSLKGEKVGTHEISDAIFNAPANAALVHDVVTAYAANARQVLAHVKGRGEVNGGGKKPWKQKGTGRARHGSIRSPLWVGGGVTFGPTSARVFSKKINKAAAKKALAILLSDRVRENNLILVDAWSFEQPKTKVAAQFISKVVPEGKILVVHTNDTKVVRSFNNIPNVEIIRASDVNAGQIIKAKKVVVSLDALEMVTARLAK